MEVAITRAAIVVGPLADGAVAAAGLRTSMNAALRVLAHGMRRSGVWVEVVLASTLKGDVEVGMVSGVATIINIIGCGTSVKCILAGGDPLNNVTPMVNAWKASAFS